MYLIAPDKKLWQLKRLNIFLYLNENKWCYFCQKRPAEALLMSTHNQCGHPITKSCLYNFDPLKPHFYVVKLGFTGYTLLFLFLLKNIDCGYSWEPPLRGGSHEYPQSVFCAEIWKISEFFIRKFSFFLVVKFSVYLNRRAFIMLLIWRFTLFENVLNMLWIFRHVYTDATFLWRL